MTTHDARVDAAEEQEQPPTCYCIILSRDSTPRTISSKGDSRSERDIAKSRVHVTSKSTGSNEDRRGTKMKSKVHRLEEKTHPTNKNLIRKQVEVKHERAKRSKSKSMFHGDYLQVDGRRRKKQGEKVSLVRLVTTTFTASVCVGLRQPADNGKSSTL